MMETALWILAFFHICGLPESDPGVTEDAIWPKEMIRPMTINGVTCP